MKNKKQFPCSTVLLLILVTLELIPKHSWEHLYFAVAPELSLLRYWKTCLKSLQTSSLQASVIHAFLNQDSFPHPFSTLPALCLQLGEVRACPCTAFPTKVPSTCCSHLYHLPLCVTPSAELHWMGSFPLSFTPETHFHNLFVLYS